MRRFLLFVPLFVFACGALAAGKSEQSLYRQVLVNHIVQLEAEDGYCTAVMVAANTFLTANHCIDVQPLQLHDQFHASYPADVIKHDEVFDLALLHSMVHTKTPITLATDLPDGTPVMGVGYSSIFNAIQVPSYVMGMVVATYKDSLVVVDHSFRPGYSGGPLITFDGKLVGINVMSEPSRNLGLSVSLKVIRFFLEEQ